MLTKNNFKIYFIGICGSGMSTLAKYLNKRGFWVAGSDVSMGENYLDLINCGITVYSSHDAKNVRDADIVVVSSSISCSNAEYLEALRLNKAIYKRAELLGLVFSTFKNTVGYAGSHGKTTAVCMGSHILKRSLTGFVSLIGGKDLDLDNFQYNNNSKILLGEVCEFDRNIKYVHPLVSVVLNVDNDHLNSYSDIFDLKNEFYSYLDRAKFKIVCKDDKFLKEYTSNNVITYSIKEKSDYKAENVKSSNGKYSFTCKLKNGNSIEVNLNVYGKHNIYNALANIAVFDSVFKLDAEIIKSGLESFNGVVRRFEYLGSVNDINFYADYCHHPTEIKESLKVYKETVKDDYVIIFQPHTYSRTKLLFNDFISVFKNENVVIYKTYPSREKKMSKGDGKRLAKALKCPYIKNEKIFKKAVVNGKYAKNYILLGAGNLYDIANSIVKNGLV